MSVGEPHQWNRTMCQVRLRLERPAPTLLRSPTVKWQLDIALPSHPLVTARSCLALPNGRGKGCTPTANVTNEGVVGQQL